MWALDTNSLNIRLRNALPGTTTFAAKERTPSSDSNSRCVIYFTLSANLIIYFILISFLGGRRASIRLLLSLIPKNSARWPSTLFTYLIVRPRASQIILNAL